MAAGAGQKLEEGPEELGHRRKLRSQQLGLGVAGRQGAGSSGTGTGVEGQKCRQLGLAGLVFTEVMQREEQRSDRVELLAAKGAHASPQPG